MPTGTELFWGMAGTIALLAAALRQTAVALASQKRIDRVSAEATRTAALEVAATRQAAARAPRPGRGRLLLPAGAAAAVIAAIAAKAHHVPGSAGKTSPKPAVPAPGPATPTVPKIPPAVVHAAHGWLPPSGTQIIIAVIIIAVLVTGYRLARLRA